MSNIDLFDQYLKKELSESARNDFNQKIKSDQLFAKEFAEHIEIKAAAKVTRIVNESDNFQKKPSSSKYKFLAILLFAITALIIAFIFMQNANKKEVLYAYDINPPIDLTERSNDNSLYPKIQKSFNQDDFDEALILINQALGEDTKDYRLLLYKGRCLRDKEKPDFIAAIVIFDEVISDSILEDEAKWHKAITLYKNNQMPAAKRLLEEIVAKPNHPEYKNASGFLKDKF